MHSPSCPQDIAAPQHIPPAQNGDASYVLTPSQAATAVPLSSTSVRHRGQARHFAGPCRAMLIPSLDVVPLEPPAGPPRDGGPGASPQPQRTATED